MSGDADRAWRSMVQGPEPSAPKSPTDPKDDHGGRGEAGAIGESSPQRPPPARAARRGHGLPAAAVWAGVAVLGVAALVALAGVMIKAGVWRSAPAETAGPRAVEGAPAALARVNLNTATAAQLDALPGIGPALAQRIIDDRTRNGPYQQVEQLDRVPGIGPKTLANLKPLVTVAE